MIRCAHGLMAKVQEEEDTIRQYFQPEQKVRARDIGLFCG